MRHLRAIYKNPEKVRGYWRQQARGVGGNFDRIVKHELYNHSWSVTVKALIDGGQITNRSEILEVGCGWGRILVGLRRHCPKARIVGIDITKDFVEKSKRVLEQEFGNCDVSILQGDAMQLEFEDGCFDTIVSSRVLQYVIDPQKAVEGFWRVLKNGGRVVVCLPNKWNPIRAITYRTKLYSCKEMGEWLTSAGFRIERMGTINFFPSTIWRFGEKNRAVHTLEKIMQRLPLIRWIGALNCVVGEKERE